MYPPINSTGVCKPIVAVPRPVRLVLASLKISTAASENFTFVEDEGRILHADGILTIVNYDYEHPISDTLDTHLERGLQSNRTIILVDYKEIEWLFNVHIDTLNLLVL